MPQSSMVSSNTIGNKLTAEEQWNKLRLVKEIAEQVWGSSLLINHKSGLVIAKQS